MSNQTDTDIITSLESNNIEIANQSKTVVQERLYSSDQNLLGLLIDHYIQTKSDVFLELSIGINEFLVGYFFEKINEYLKHGFTVNVCTIIFKIVKKQPSWLHKIIGTPLFSTLLKLLKVDQDVVFIMYGVLILSSLLPCVPALISSNINDVLEIFMRIANYFFINAGNLPEACALNLHVGLYILFQTLYTMYPNILLNYLRKDFCLNKKSETVFIQVIKPMFEFVKFHPDLITDTVKSEISFDKWKGLQPHDVLVQCRKMSLDQIDCIKEASFAVYDSSLESEIVTDKPITESLNIFFTTPDVRINSDSLDNEIKRDGVGQGKRKDSFCNPTEICALSTPPSLTRSCSTQDMSSVDFGIRYNLDIRKSNQILSDVSEKLVLSSTGTFSSPNSSANKQSLIKTKSFGSGDKFSNRAMFRSLSSFNCQSTPVNCCHPTKDVHAFDNVSQSKGLSLDKERVENEDISTALLDFGPDDRSGQSTKNCPIISVDEDSDWDAAREKMRNKKLLFYDGLKTDLSIKPAIDTPLGNTAHDSSFFFRTIKELLSNNFSNSFSNNLQTFSMETERSSPLNMLDDLLKYGSAIHSSNSNQEKHTHQIDADLTDDESKPADELNYLQTQVKLLSIQLHYERYKCDLHCLRNRRLFGNLQKVQKDHDEIDTYKDQIILCETKLHEMKIALGLKRDENKLLKEQLAQKEENLNLEIYNSKKENDALDYQLKNHEMKYEYEEQQRKSSERELQRIKYKLFDTKQLYKDAISKLSGLDHYHHIKSTLEKELLAQYDKQETLKHQICQGTVKMNQQIDLENKIVSLSNDLEECRGENHVLLLQRESYKFRTDELESSLLKKDNIIMDLRVYLKKIHSKHKDEINAIESRLNGLMRTCYSLQSYITCLYAKLEEPRHSKCGAKSTVAANLDCNELCQKLPYGAGSNDNSHRHSFYSSDNPFKAQKLLQSDERDSFNRPSF